MNLKGSQHFTATGFSAEEYAKAKSLLLTEATGPYQKENASKETPAPPSPLHSPGSHASGRMQSAEASPTRSSTPISVDAPDWMRPWGWLVTWIGIVAFSTTSFVFWKPSDARTALVLGLSNPFCFIGLPVGLYWMHRSGELDRLGGVVLVMSLMLAGIIVLAIVCGFQ